MREEAFWGLKNTKNPGASRGSAPWTPGLEPVGATPGPHQEARVGPWTLHRARSALPFGQKRF